MHKLTDGGRQLASKLVGFISLLTFADVSHSLEGNISSLALKATHPVSDARASGGVVEQFAGYVGERHGGRQRDGLLQARRLYLLADQLRPLLLARGYPVEELRQLRVRVLRTEVQVEECEDILIK